MRDLSGLVCLESLEVLDLEDNDITELFEFDMCDSITQINLRNNKIEDVSELSYVSALPKLNYLCILDNPCCNEKTRMENKIKDNFKDEIIVDNGYTWIQIALEHNYFWIKAMYDDKDNLIEIYIDIIIH